MSKVLIRQELLEKAVRRFLSRPGANIVPFDRIPGQDVHFAVADSSIKELPSFYPRVEEFGYKGVIYKILLPKNLVISRR